MFKRLSFLLLAVIILFLIVNNVFAGTFKLPDTGQTKCYQGVSPYSEIPCEGTGQDGAYNINPLSYTDNGNGTVTDNNTGIMWQKYENASTYNWYQASGTYDATYNPTTQNICGSLNLGSSSDWRLPSKKELMSIVAYGIPFPGATIDTTYFPNTHESNYWSSTTVAGYPDLAWHVHFYDGAVDDAIVYDYYKNYSLFVRCVRGGQSGSFGNWVPIPGLTASSPALAWNPIANKLQMVVRASNDTIWASTFSTSGVFNNDWVNIPGLTASPPALAWNPLANEMQLAVRGSDGPSIWTATFNSSGAFNNDWVNIPGGMASSPALAWNQGTNKMQMVVRAYNDTLWASTFSTSGVFNNDWVNIPGLTASAPALAWDGFEARLSMMVRASNDTIWASTFNSSGVFNNDWLKIPGLTSSSPGMAYLPSIGYLGIVVRASDDSLWEMLY